MFSGFAFRPAVGFAPVGSAPFGHPVLVGPAADPVDQAFGFVARRLPLVFDRTFAFLVRLVYSLTYCSS